MESLRKVPGVLVAHGVSSMQLTAWSQSPCSPLRMSEVSLIGTLHPPQSPRTRCPPSSEGRPQWDPLSLPVEAASSPGCCVSAQVNLPTRGSRRTKHLRRQESGHMVSVPPGMYFSGGQSSCAEPMSNDDRPAPHSLWAAAEVELPSELETEFSLHPCDAARSGLRPVTMCIQAGIWRAQKRTKAGMVSWELFSVFQAVEWKLYIYPQ